jgi:hypothetical protein
MAQKNYSLPRWEKKDRSDALTTAEEVNKLKKLI